MRQHLHRNSTLVISCVAMLALAGTAMGQNALGDGRKLDNNLNSSQGRVNPRSTGVSEQVRYNNAVIYGTAPGGKSFQGSIGSRATDQFGGSLGSDTLYNFRRDSFTSGLAAEGVRGSDALRYQFALTTGQNIPGFLGNASISVPRTGTVSTGATSSALRSTSDFVTGQSYRPTLVGIRHDELGAEYTAKASPLLGVAWVKTGESPLGNSLAPIPSNVPAAVPAIPGVPPVNPADATNPPTPSPNKLVERPLISPFSGLESTARGVQNALDRPGLVDLRVQQDGTQSRTAVHNQLINRMREGYPEKPAAKPGETAIEAVTFEMQMDRLHRVLSGEPEPEKKSLTGRAPDGSVLIPPRNVDPKNTTSAATPRPSGAIDKDINGKTIDPALEALTPNFLRAVKKVQEKKLKHFAEPAPVIGPDTSSDPETYRGQMRDGEKLLAAGRFFDAEDHFIRAIACSPHDPMARAARLHAQIGAGLYLSAATNLRALLTGHPEMLATRYTDNLLPTQERAKVIVEQLVEQEKKSESALGRDSALLIAYMGYQRGDTKLVTDGLQSFSKRIAPDTSGDPDRVLLTLLTATWGTK